jgi:hypothetical protein
MPADLQTTKLHMGFCVARIMHSTRRTCRQFEGKMYELQGYVQNMAQSTKRMQQLTKSKQTTERPARKEGNVSVASDL